MSKDKSKMMPCQRRWLQDDHQFHGKLSPAFELRDLPGWHAQAPAIWIEETAPVFQNRSLTEEISRVLDLAEQVIGMGAESDIGNT